MSIWDRVIGQDTSVGLLRGAIERPSHAYLLTGAPGVGVELVARCFAAALVCADGGCGVCGTCDRVLRSRHPDVVEVEPEGTFLVVEQVEEIAHEVFASPYEAQRRVIVVHEAERMHEAAANKMLKLLEEPPPRTALVLVTSSPDELLDTVRSRCQQVTLGAMSAADVRLAVARASDDKGEGVGNEDGVEIGDGDLDLAVGLSGGRVDRALRFCSDLGVLRVAVLDALALLDGSGATVMASANEIEAAVQRALEALEAEQEAERSVLNEELAQAEYPDRVVRSMRSALERRQTRLTRRARVDLLTEVVVSIETLLRDALVPPTLAINADRPIPVIDAVTCNAALDACHQAHSTLDRRIALNERLFLERLLLDLPSLSRHTF